MMTCQHNNMKLEIETSGDLTLIIVELVLGFPIKFLVQLRNVGVRSVS